MLRQLVDNPARARVADVELALHERHRRAALRGDGACSTREQRIQLALGGVASLPLRALTLFEDLFHVAGSALRAPEVDDRLDLRVAHERALDAGRLARVDRLIKHVSAAEQLLRAAGVEDDPAVDLRADSECDARRDVGLDKARDDVRRRALRGDDEVDADRAGELRDAADELLDLACRDHHEVGELVDDDDYIRQLARELLRGFVVVGGDVAHTFGREHLVAAVHFGHGPSQCGRGLVRLDEHRQGEVRQPVVVGELHSLGVDEQQTHVVGRDLEQQARDQSVDAHALALARRAGDEQVRHARQIADDRLAGDVVTERQRQFVRALAKRRRLHDLADRDQAGGFVRHLDTHRRLARDGRFDAQWRGRQRE